MKKLLLLLVLISTSGCMPVRPDYGVRVIDGKLEGILPMRDGKVYYNEVVKFDSLPAQLVFRQSRRWLALNIPSASVALTMGDPVNHDLIADARISSMTLNVSDEALATSPALQIGMTLECNDGSYRCAFGNFRTETIDPVTAKPMSSMLERSYYYSQADARKHLRHIDETVREWLASLKKFVEEEGK